MASERAGKALSDFREFALGHYEKPGVSDLCLALQDSAGVNVGVLLFLGWARANHLVLDLESVHALRDGVHFWHEEVVVPLRNLRRRLKSRAAEICAVATFREELKELELHAEFVEMDFLEDCGAEILLGRSQSPNLPASWSVREAIAHLAELSAGRPLTSQEGFAVEGLAEALSV